MEEAVIVAIDKLNELKGRQDKEQAHTEADQILCNLVRLLPRGEAAADHYYGVRRLCSRD